MRWGWGGFPYDVHCKLWCFTTEEEWETGEKMYRGEAVLMGSQEDGEVCGALLVDMYNWVLISTDWKQGSEQGSPQL